MNYAELALIGCILAVDATVYAFSYGLILRKRRHLSALWFALVVGSYQALMPLLGYVGGGRVRHVVDAWDHWIVLAVFSILGGSIIRQAWKKENESEAAPRGPLGFASLMVVGIATSIDALAVGVCMALGDIGGAIKGWYQLILAAALIGGITFCCAMAAFHSARLMHRLPMKWLEVLAGILLIALGLHNVWRELF